MLTTKTIEQKRAYTVADITQETGVKSAAVVRRILRGAAIKNPNLNVWSHQTGRSKCVKSTETTGS